MARSGQQRVVNRSLGAADSSLRRVLVTRAAHQASSLGDALAANGMLVVSIPTIAIGPPADGFESLHAALHELDRFDWIVFTSANAVSAFQQARESQDVEEVLPRIASIGPATSAALTGAGLSAHLQPSAAVAESLAAALVPLVRGRSVLLVQAEQTRGVLEPELRQAGAHVQVAEAYRNTVPAGSADLLKRELPSLAAATFASGSAVRNLLALCDEAGLTLPHSLVLASIGPVTSAVLREYGYEPHLEASTPRIEVLASELARWLRLRRT